MLVLTRKIYESIIVEVSGVAVKIQLINTSKGKAKIGVEAPRHVVIAREEITADKRA